MIVLRPRYPMFGTLFGIFDSLGLKFRFGVRVGLGEGGWGVWAEPSSLRESIGKPVSSKKSDLFWSDLGW
jgi:hypothetical protein